MEFELFTFINVLIIGIEFDEIFLLSYLISSFLFLSNFILSVSNYFLTYFKRRDSNIIWRFAFNIELFDMNFPRHCFHSSSFSDIFEFIIFSYDSFHQFFKFLNFFLFPFPKKFYLLFNFIDALILLSEFFKKIELSVNFR